jgi:ArsR family transcriptional regulator
MLEREALAVGELARVLQLPQSTVSRHLKTLLDGGWVIKQAQGTASVYSFTGDALDESARELWALTSRHLGPLPAFEDDDARLRQVLAERRQDSKAFFGRLGGEWDDLRQELFGETFSDEALLALLDPSWVVADLGCGTGNVAERLAPLVQRVHAVDREPAMLEAARRRLADLPNVDFIEGELAALPLQSGSIDAAVSILVLHHVADLDVGIAEIARVLRPGGVAMIVDMVAHDREIYRHTMGHQHLGFDQETIEGVAAAAGLVDVRYRRLTPDTSARGPGLFVATMRRA